MNNVEASLTELLKVSKNIEKAIKSIQNTKYLITQKYKSLGLYWNDNRYKELGDTIQECSQALNNILKVLLQSDKKIHILIKQLEDYENVRLSDSNNSISHGFQNLASPLLGMAGYQYCLGVLVKGSLDSDYIQLLENRRNNAVAKVGKVFDIFSGRVIIRDGDYPSNQTPHYSPSSRLHHMRGVYYNANMDMNNPRGNGTTFFHELGHMIDHASTGYNGNLSHTLAFGNALREDGERVLNVFNNMSVERQEAFLNRIRQNSAHSFSDLIDATTNGQIHGSYGHTREYWQRDGNLQAEAFAHFFEASMGGGRKLDFLANLFPTAFSMFNEMIDAILQNN